MRTVEFEIGDVAFGGNAVGRVDGKAVFVPFAIDGERVRAQIVREKRQFAEADLVEILTASPQRTQPECLYFGRCGGCRYQHIEYAHQLELKRHQVEQALRRIGKLDVPVAPMIASPKPYAYRNRITVHSEDGLVGYYRYDAHQLIDVAQCPIAAPEVNVALAELRARKPRPGHYTLRAHSGPRVFEQTNDEVAELLVRHIEALIPNEQELLLDAYCGAGFFTKRLREKFTRVVGIEWDRYAVAAARENAAPNESYISGDVDLELSRQLLAADAARTCVIVDPPATGLSAGARHALLDRPMNTLTYVSCNPSTLARDLKELGSRYKIISVTPFDMFPQTAEIEAVALLRRREA